MTLKHLLNRHRLFIKSMLIGITLLIISNMDSFAQRQRNYIYVLDCTSSMKRNKVWEPAKKFLHEDIWKLDDNSTVSIILFHQNLSIPVVRQKVSWVKKNWCDVNKIGIDSICNLMLKRSKLTGICRAWDKGLSFLDKGRNNYLYFFTDGLENVIPHNGTAAVCQRIINWNRTSKGNYAFFVALSLKESKEVKAIEDATDNKNTFYINSHLGPFGAFDRTSFKLNSHSIKNIKVGFSDYGHFQANTICNDPYYQVTLKDGIKDGRAEFVIKERQRPSSNHFVHVKVVTKPTVLHITTPDLFIDVDTRNLANLDLAQQSGLENGQYVAGTANTYGSFLFNKGKSFDVAKVDLGASFNDQAKKRGCNLVMMISSPSLYHFKYNGKPVDRSFIISSKDYKSILEIEVPHNSPKGDITIHLRGHSSTLETINAEETKNYINSVRFAHEECWNPLKTILFWAVIAVTAVLLLWFLLLRPICYPRIRLSRIQMTDSNGYFVGKKINGAKKVIVGPNKGHQSFINKLFTRRIVYIVSPMWQSVWEMYPKGRKKVVRVNLHGNYMIKPITFEFENLKTYQLVDKKSNNVITIKIL